ncbi:MAG: endonuclease/exonuclease/phosphatase family protein [Patescibacteria group bacterium]|nr:endonuclease/exonuclease/phosphatase family protein [Patescibacteria group bacterium]
MKIYSWNMLFVNRELERAFAFIRDSDADIFCLQEVPEPFLKRLRASSFSIAYRNDMTKLFCSGTVHTYNVILSRHPLLAQGEIPYEDYWPLLPLRTRFFVFLMRPFLFTKIRDRGGIYADVRIGGTLVRVFNLHLILARPQWRLREFEAAMAKREPSLPTVVCGDFNILESPKISILNWLVGGAFGDAVFWKRERAAIEERFSTHALANPLRGRSTHPISRSQLDHILVSEDFTVARAAVLPDRIGSDHHPIFAEATLDMRA